MFKIIPFNAEIHLPIIEQYDNEAPLANLNNVSFVPCDQVRIYELDGQFCAYAYYLSKLYKIYIQRVFVREEYRRNGLGTDIIEDLKTRLSTERGRMIAEVNEDDVVSQIWLRSNGFRCNETTISTYIFDYYY